jgi:hypothetical protein
VQRGGVPKANTPQLLVGAFSSSDPALGLKAADEVRRRIQSEHNATELYIVPKSTIEQTLRGSGYNPDSALAPADLVALGKQVRSDYALAGAVEQEGAGALLTALRVIVPEYSGTPSMSEAPPPALDRGAAAPVSADLRP